MENLTQLFNYEGNKVTFKNENGVTYVNATQMGKVFGKTPKDYLRTQIAEDLTVALSSRLKCLVPDLVQVINGGNNRGTWMHEDVALDYAQWLSIDFKLWCNDRIKELMTVGITATPDTLEQMLTNPDLIIGLANQLKNERAEKERLRQENELANKTIQIQAPKIEYVNNVLASESCHTTTTIAKELGMSGKALNTTLHQAKIHFKQDNHWVLYSQHQAKGYAKTRTHNYYDSEGKPRTNIATVWTEKGRLFIHEIIRNKNSSQLRIAN